jgi:hypothetical protein
MGSGIDVVVIAPGLIKTEFVPKQLALLETISHPPFYQKLLAGFLLGDISDSLQSVTMNPYYFCKWIFISFNFGFG